jgi:hypothetical protein
MAIADAGGAAGIGTTAGGGTLTGLGGVGKSTLAQQYAWDNRTRYQGVWWLRAQSSITVQDDLIDLGARFVAGLKEAQDRPAAARKTLELLAQSGDGKPWLLVYDNAESADIVDWTPPAGAHVLLTSRAPDWYGHAAEIDVGVYPRAVSVAFLLARARGSDRDLDRTAREADALAADLGDLPFALAIARAHAWGMNWTLGVYRGALEASLATLLDRDPGAGPHPARHRDGRRDAGPRTGRSRRGAGRRVAGQPRNPGRQRARHQRPPAGPGRDAATARRCGHPSQQPRATNCSRPRTASARPSR